MSVTVSISCSATPPVKAAAPSVDHDTRGSESPTEPGVGLTEPPAAWTALTLVARCTQRLHSGQTCVATVLSRVLVKPTTLRALTWRRPPTSATIR